MRGASAGDLLQTFTTREAIVTGSDGATGLTGTLVIHIVGSAVVEIWVSVAFTITLTESVEGGAVAVTVDDSGQVNSLGAESPGHSSEAHSARGTSVAVSAGGNTARAVNSDAGLIVDIEHLGATTVVQVVIGTTFTITLAVCVEGRGTAVSVCDCIHIASAWALAWGQSTKTDPARGTSMAC